MLHHQAVEKTLLLHLNIGLIRLCMTEISALITEVCKNVWLMFQFLVIVAVLLSLK